MNPDISEAVESTDRAAASAAVAPARAVLVLGMHRSGTSALARVLNLLGVELGSDLLPAAADNESGFWEHRQVQFIHDRVYETLKQDWTNVSALPDRWWEREEIEPYRRQLRELLQNEFETHPLWGMKDPRLCAMLPLWRPLLAEMNVQPECVLICRNPAEVAGSLGKRDGLSLSRVYLLWLRSIIDAERGSRGLPRAIATFEQILVDWKTQLRRIGAALDLHWPRSPDDVAAQVADFIRPSSRHHSVDDRSFLERQDVPELVRRMYSAVLKAADSGEMSDLSATVDAVAHDLDDGHPLLSQFIVDLEQQYRNTVIEKNLESIRRDQQTSALQQQIAEQNARLETAAIERAQVAGQVADLQGQLTDLNGRVSALNAQLSAWQLHASQLKAAKDAQAAELQQQQARLEWSQAESGQYQIQRAMLLKVLQQMQQLRTWRWSAVLRAWKRLPLTEWALIPVSNLRPIGPGRWRSEGEAQFALPCLPISGRIRVELKMNVSVAGHARLYFDTGHLFNPDELLDLGEVANEVNINRELMLTEPVHCFRLDPLDRSGEIEIHYFRIFCV